MLNKQIVRQGVQQALHRAIPQHEVHVNRRAQNFERPALNLEVSRISRRDLDYFTIEETVYFTVICFVEVDGHNHSDTGELERMQMQVMDVFRPGYLVMGDRAVKFTASDGGMDYDTAWVDLQCTYTTNRYTEGEELPLMGEITAKTNLTQGGAR